MGVEITKEDFFCVWNQGYGYNCQEWEHEQNSQPKNDYMIKELKSTLYSHKNHKVHLIARLILNEWKNHHPHLSFDLPLKKGYSAPVFCQLIFVNQTGFWECSNDCDTQVTLSWWRASMFLIQIYVSFLYIFSSRFCCCGE